MVTDINNLFLITSFWKYDERWGRRVIIETVTTQWQKFVLLLETADTAIIWLLLVDTVSFFLCFEWAEMRLGQNWEYKSTIASEEWTFRQQTKLSTINDTIYSKLKIHNICLSLLHCASYSWKVTKLLTNPTILQFKKTIGNNDNGDTAIWSEQITTRNSNTRWYECWT